ncbi:MAG: hypothetical protein ACI9X4_000994 [Glaciecola sp.]|jgi:hypothetical protein
MLAAFVGCQTPAPRAISLDVAGLEGDGARLVGPDGETLFPGALLGTCVLGFRPFSRESLTAVHFSFGHSGWYLYPDERARSARDLAWDPNTSLRWTTRNQEGQWLEQYAVMLPLRVADVLEIVAGHTLVVEETIDGETIVESWLLDPPYGPEEGAAEWFEGKDASGSRIPIGTMHWKGPHVNPNPNLNALRTEILRADLGGSPEVLCSGGGGRFLFLLTRNRKTQYTVLHQFDLKDGVAHSVLENSDNQRMLATCTELSVRREIGADGFSLRASGIGELQDSKGQTIERFPHNLSLSGSESFGVLEGTPSLPGLTWLEIRNLRAQRAR